MRYYDAMNMNLTKIAQAMHENPVATALLAREEAKCTEWLLQHGRTVRELLS